MELDEIQKSCIQCGRDYVSVSKPRWVFNDRLQPVATVHTKCTVPYRKAHGLKWPTAYFNVVSPLLESQRYAWLWGEEPTADTHVRMYFAADEKRRAEHRDWWVGGSLGLSEQRMTEIVAAAQELEKEFEVFTKRK